MFPAEIIRIKREKGKLSKEQIDFFIKGITDKTIADSQIGAFTMAIFLNGLDLEEITNLSLAMRDSGEVMDWSDIKNGTDFCNQDLLKNNCGDFKPNNGSKTRSTEAERTLNVREHSSNGFCNQDLLKIVDKHSSGGVGDKISIMLAPMLAVCGCFVPMIAGRGLGHTGGTLDKLESIPGYDVSPTSERFKEIVKEIGCAIIGQTPKIAPADKKIYAIRDVCATVESIPLITASITSKKLASNLDCLVMDLKCGNGAFMEDLKSAVELARSIVRVANMAGTKTKAIITDMNQVLGRNVGNAIEILEAVQYLKGEKVDQRMHEINMVLCADLLVSSKIAKNEKQAMEKLQDSIDSGKALEVFGKMVTALGGPKDFVENYEKYLPKAKIIRPVYSEVEGYVESMDTRKIGLSIIEMKGGRKHPDDKLDLATGFSDFCQIGDAITKTKPLAIVHAQTEEQFSNAQDELRFFIHLSTKKPTKKSPILDRVE